MVDAGFGAYRDLSSRERCARKGMQRMTWKVLIADDDPVVLTLLTALLDGEPDFTVVGTARDAAAAQTVAARTAPDLALLDVSMPRGGGPAAAAALRASRPAIRLVALSASEDVATVRTMLEAGVNRYAVKGTPNQELLALLRAVMHDGGTASLDGARRAPRFARGSIGVLAAMADARALLAVAEVIASDPALELVGLAQTAGHAATLASRHQPAVALIDTALDAEGGSASRRVLASAPSTEVIALWGGDDHGALLRGIRASAREPVRPARVTDAIRDVATGGAALEPSLAAALVEELVARPSRAEPAGIAGRVARVAGGEGLVTLLQPVVDLHDLGVVGFEALTRFTVSPRQSPDVWFAEAAAVGRGVELEVAAVARALAALPGLPEETWLSVNLSPAAAAARRIADLLRGVDGRRIVIEMTEHAPVLDYDGLADALSPLREAGVRIAVDDAGAGFASLRHILLLRPDFIKLDVSLCRGAGADGARRAMARALVGFAAETGSQVIAEGLESPDDVAALRALDVPLGQGYELGRPAPVARV